MFERLILSYLFYKDFSLKSNDHLEKSEIREQEILLLEQKKVLLNSKIISGNCYLIQINYRMSENNLTERQRKIQQYLSKYRIEEVLGDLLNTLAHSLDPNPVVFMIKYLSNLCSKKELEENGIVINGPAPSPNLAIVFPNFTNPNKNLFKTYLTFDNFLQAKNQKTSQNVSLRDLINIGLENEEHPVGIFAADKDTYSTFSSIFDPILKDMNKGMETTGYKYAEKVDVKELLSQDYALTEKENKTLDQITVKIKRNLPDYTFNTFNSTADRDAIVEKLGQTLKDLNEQFEDFHNWGMIN